MYINLENVDEMYKKLKDRVTDRKEQFDEFIAFLENKTTWFTSPASTKYHLSIEKGLLIHSVGVAYTLLEMKAALMSFLDDESCIITGLFHDVGKLGMPGKPLYIKGSSGYYYNPKVVSMGLGVRSLYLISKFIDLTGDEAQAIAYHDGQYIDENHIVANRERPLTLLAHYADYWTAHIFEDEIMRKEFIKRNTLGVLKSGIEYYPDQTTPEAVEKYKSLESELKDEYFRRDKIGKGDAGGGE